MTDRNRNRDDDRSSRHSRDDEDRGSSRRSSRDDDSRGSSRGRDDDRSERGSRGSSRGRDRDDEDRGSSRSSGRSSSYEYQGRTADSVRARASKGANDYDKLLKPHIKTWKPNDGPNRIRILPPTWPKAEHFGYDVHVHYGVGPDRGQYLDLHKMLGQPDPIHEEYSRAKQELDPDNKSDAKYLKDLAGTRRVLLYLIDRDHEKEGVQCWIAPWTVDRDITKISVDRQSGEVLPIDHPEDGYDVEFDKTGTKDRTEYTGLSIARRSSPLGKDEWLDFAMDNPLPDQLVYFDYDHIAKAFGGVGAHREASRGRDDDDDSRGSSRSSRDRDDRPTGGRGRDSDSRDSGGRDRGSSNSDAPTWESVHEMTGRELKDLIEQERLDIDPREAKDDEDLADWICDEMKLEKAEPRRSSSRGRDDEDRGGSSTRRSVRDDNDDEDRLSRMRNRRD